MSPGSVAAEGIVVEKDMLLFRVIYRSQREPQQNHTKHHREPDPEISHFGTSEEEKIHPGRNTTTAPVSWPPQVICREHYPRGG
jgi:hypothetical protein